MSERRRWNTAERDSLRRMVKAGETDKAIAAALNRPRNSVCTERHRMGLGETKRKTGRPKREWLACEEARLRELWLAGVRVIEIAAELERHQDTISPKARELRLPLRVNIMVGGQFRIVLRGQRAPERSKRACLRCRNQFPSEGVGNRLCPACAKGIAEGKIGQEPDTYGFGGNGRKRAA